MTLGYAAICPWKVTHEPVTKRVTWQADLVEAYEDTWDWSLRAAGQTEPLQTALHSITEEPDFLSPWQAEARALALRHEVLTEEFDELSRSFDLRRPSLMTRHSHSLMLNYGSQPFSNWRLFPPKDPLPLQPKENVDTDWLDALLEHRQPTQDPPPLGDFDSWVRELWLTLGRFGATTRDGQDFIVPIATWFLHSWTDRFCTRARIFHFDDNYDLWSNDVQRLWQDKIAPGRRVTYYYVQPGPPRGEDDLVYGHLILAQADQDDYATLCSSLAEGHPRRIHHQAALLPGEVGVADILSKLGSEAQCRNRAQLGAPCIIEINDRQLVEGELYACENGDNFVINIPFPTSTTFQPSDEDDDAMSLMAMQGPFDFPEAPIADMPHAVAQGDEVEGPPLEVELPSHSGDEDIDEGIADNTETNELDYDPYHARLSYHNLDRDIVRVLNLRTHDLRSWQHLPEDLMATSTAGILVNQHGDIPTGSTHRLVLVDVVFFSNDPAAETEVDRTVRLLPHFLTRSHKESAFQCTRAFPFLSSSSRL